MTTPQPAAVPAPSNASPTRVTPQSGILNRPPEHLILAAFSISGDPASAVDHLRAIVRNELTSTIAADTDPSTAQPETGELGYAPNHDRAHLTVTVGFASTAYDKLGIPTNDRPADLVPIPWDKLGDTPQDSNSGDIVLQI
jgi:deferrochelatase/peroxidase EfeB